MDEGVQSLPNSDEVLVCTSETTSEEVTTAVTRSFGMPHRYESSGTGYRATLYSFKLKLSTKEWTFVVALC